MTYQLANGKTIYMSEDQFFKMTDQDLKDLEGSSYGFTINDPFYDSVLSGEIPEDTIEEDPLEELGVIEE